MRQGVDKLKQFIKQNSELPPKVIKTRVVYEKKKKKKKTKKPKVNMQKGVVIRDCICEVNGD
jgi:hypothetical protein